jgi:hypothetical protein
VRFTTLKIGELRLYSENKEDIFSFPSPDAAIVFQEISGSKGIATTGTFYFLSTAIESYKKKRVPDAGTVVGAQYYWKVLQTAP